jgi:raffinose/stachyose/melibiose transport system substrate-binding protein
MYSGLGANFYGGEASRQALVAGEMKMTDAPFVAAFAAMDELQPYFPDGYQSIDYVGQQQLFGTGQAGMYIGGSWEIATFEGLGLTDVGYFAPPVENAGDTVSICFHVDFGVGINKDSANIEAALAYANWLATPEFAALFMNAVPGFFSYVPGDYTLTNALAAEMIAATSGADITIRTTWEKLASGVPSGYDLMLEAMAGLLTDEYTPEEAAAHVEDGLEQWYEPLQ